MRPRPQPGQIRPKVSTMPRQQSEATVYLEVYKLVVERKRLQEELQKIEVRSQQIQQRLGQLDHQIGDLETNLQQMRASEAEPTASAIAPAQVNRSSVTTTNSQPETFEMMFLEY
jgi:phage shock protein A